MEIQGIGNDIIAIARMRSALSRHNQRFLQKVFTPLEQAYCLANKDPVPHLTGRFAAKEAVVKALGVGFSDGLNWLDIEIRRQASGQPLVQLSPHAALKLGHPLFLISISHCHEYATAVAIWLSGQSPKG